MLPYKIINYHVTKNKYALLIPTLNEGKYIDKQLLRMEKENIFSKIDVYILDSNSNDGSLSNQKLKRLGVISKLLILQGKQGTAFRCGFYEALKRNYQGIITVDGNNKDSIEDIPKFIDYLDKKYDFIQGSRFKKGGGHKNTPFIRLLANKLILIPWCRLLSKYPYTEVASAYRAMSRRLLKDDKLSIFRDCFIGYELLWYISVMAPKLGYRVNEIPVRRIYPPEKKIPTKITFSRSIGIIYQLFKLTIGIYRIH